MYKFEFESFVGENTSGNHNKFYYAAAVRIENVSGSIVSQFLFKRYGKIGAKGFLSFEKISAVGSATIELSRLRQLKLNRGYERMSRSLLMEWLFRDDFLNFEEEFKNMVSDGESDIRSAFATSLNAIGTQSVENYMINAILEGFEIEPAEERAEELKAEKIDGAKAYNSWGAWA